MSVWRLAEENAMGGLEGHVLLGQGRRAARQTTSRGVKDLLATAARGSVGSCPASGRRALMHSYVP